jgi:hypothetical protein
MPRIIFICVVSSCHGAGAVCDAATSHRSGGLQTAIGDRRANDGVRRGGRRYISKVKKEKPAVPLCGTAG